jgi:hypothetical protein
LSRREARSLLLAAPVLVAAACVGDNTEYMGAHTPFAGCDQRPAAPPATLGLDAFYTKYLDGYGTPVLGSADVSDQALQLACRITGEMVSLREDVRQALADHHLRVAVLAQSEVTTDIPEYADLYTAFPDKDWNTLRGIGATRIRPVASCAEENLLCLPGDPFASASVLVQMLGHGLRDLGIKAIDSEFGSQVQSAYASALAQGLWAGTAAAANVQDYWAVTTEAWFGVNSRLPARGHAAVMQYDPSLGALFAAYLPADDWRPGCY